MYDVDDIDSKNEAKYMVIMVVKKRTEQKNPLLNRSEAY